jgi:hypothetical protein
MQGVPPLAVQVTFFLAVIEKVTFELPGIIIYSADPEEAEELEQVLAQFFCM